MSCVTLFAHYDPDNIIADYILFHLKHLKENSDFLVFITTSRLDEMELQKLSGIVSEVVIQPQNVGFDFYSWSSYLVKHRAEIEKYDGLLLTNSSIIGPLFPLGPIIQSMQSHAYWGMTDSYQIDYHLQSYFVFFQGNTVRTQIFWDFFENIIPFPSVDSVIQAYEVNLTRYLQHFFGKPGVVALKEASFVRRRVFKFFSFHKEKKEEWMLVYKHFGLFKYLELRDAVNPCFYFSDQLIAQQFPYVKVKLLKNNHYNCNLKRTRTCLLESGINLSGMIL